ncbi:MAG: O-methyltransferase [Flavobacteriaceae bacterium]|nr:O-methyltransferase [Flavobacteriaceae bacterium]
MNFIDEKLMAYALDHSESEPELLQQLSRETWQRSIAPNMLSGHFQGRLLSMLSKLVKPEAILEIGTFTGYSALCLAEGLKSNGILHTIDCNEELVDFQKKYFSQSVFKDQIISYLGDATEIIPKLQTKFDLVFIDADKANYCNYFHLVIEKMNPGGLIISDNVLWYGKVVQPLKKDDLDTQAILAYNHLLKNDPRIETVLLPIRDGLTLSRVKDKV